MSWVAYTVHCDREAALRALIEYSDCKKPLRVNRNIVEIWEPDVVPPAEVDLPTQAELLQLQSHLIVVLNQVNSLVNRYAQN